MKDSDKWETPQRLFDELNKEFKFKVDLCASEENTKCINYYSDYLDDCGTLGFCVGVDYWYTGLDNDQSVFMNPPYSNPKPFIEKAWNDSKYVKIVMLLKCDPSTSWWAVFYDYENQKPKEGVEIRYLPKRLKFERNGIPGQTAPFPSVIVILDRRGK